MLGFATLAGGANSSCKGRLRVDAQLPGMPEPMVAYFDLRTRKGISVISPPGMPPMAIEMELDRRGGHGVAAGNEQRAGSATVAGETCDLWRMEPTTAEEKAMVGVACITPDGIPLRIEATVQGKREVVFPGDGDQPRAARRVVDDATSKRGADADAERNDATLQVRRRTFMPPRTAHGGAGVWGG